MTIAQLAAAIEDFAPLHLQEDYDNAGLCVGNAQAEASGALLCLDATEDAVRTAIERGINIVVSHHPPIFGGLKRLVGATSAERVVMLAVKHDVALYAAHTNLDKVRGGVSERMCERLGLLNRRLLQPSASRADVGLGMVGALPAPLPTGDFLQLVKQAFNRQNIRYAASRKACVSTVAVCGGSGADLMPLAEACGADALVSADFKYHQLQMAVGGEVMPIDVGHYESEIEAVDIFFEIISKKFPTFAPHLVKYTVNQIGYL
jgi:dinuclear metal center YbgI/SA1388 family protein